MAKRKNKTYHCLLNVVAETLDHRWLDYTGLISYDGFDRLPDIYLVTKLLQSHHFDMCDIDTYAYQCEYVSDMVWACLRGLYSSGHIDNFTIAPVVDKDD